MIWLVGIGGSVGAAVRFLLGGYINNRAHRFRPFPLGTWFINMTGSFLLGLAINLYDSGVINEGLWLFAGVGFCGAYTTFSTFGYETIAMVRAKEYRTAFFYVAGTLFASLIITLSGMII